MENLFDFFDKLSSASGFHQIYLELKKELDAELSGHKNGNFIIFNDNSNFLFKFQNRFEHEIQEIVKKIKKYTLECESEEKIKIYINQIYQFNKALIEKCRTFGLAFEGIKDYQVILGSAVFSLMSLQDSLQRNYSKYVEIDKTKVTITNFEIHFLNRFKSYKENLFDKEHKPDCKFYKYNHKEFVEFKSDLINKFQNNYSDYLINWISSERKLGHTFSEKDFINFLLKHIASDIGHSSELGEVIFTSISNHKYVFPLNFFNDNIQSVINEIKAFLHKRIEFIASPEIKIIPTEEIWEAIHPEIKKVSLTRFNTGHYADAVEAAFKEINDIIKKEYKLVTGKEEDGDALMRKSFSVNNPLFKLADISTESGKNIQQGYMEIFAGAMKGIRNPKAHANLNVHPNEAWEMIILSSHLMRMWDKRQS